jgi:hypothetical protein
LAITVNKEITKVSLAQEGKLGEVLEPQAFWVRLEGSMLKYLVK